MCIVLFLPISYTFVDTNTVIALYRIFQYSVCNGKPQMLLQQVLLYHSLISVKLVVGFGGSLLGSTPVVHTHGRTITVG